MKLGKRLVAVLLACSLFMAVLPCVQASKHESNYTVAGLEGPYCDEELSQLAISNGGEYCLVPGTTLYFKLRSSIGGSIPATEPRPQLVVTEHTNDGAAEKPELITARDCGNEVWAVKIALTPSYDEKERTYRAQLQIDGYSQTVSFTIANRTVSASPSFWVDNEAPLVLFDRYQTQKQVVNMYVGDVAEVTLQALGQEPVYMGYSTESDRDVVKEYAWQNLRFITFTGQPKFAYPASVKLLAEEGWVLYERTEAGFRKIETQYLDNGLVFETQKLTTYMLSEGELGSGTPQEKLNGIIDDDELVKNNSFTGR